MLQPLKTESLEGKGPTRLVQLALRHICSDQPLEQLRELLKLIEQVVEQPTALEILESLLRYYVQGTRRLDEQDVRVLLQNTRSGEPLCKPSLINILSRAYSRASATARPRCCCG